LIGWLISLLRGEAGVDWVAVV